MADVFLRCASILSAVCGMAWLALAMKAHWLQVWEGSTYSAALAGRLRARGASALLVSLCACLAVDHASMATLVWVMTSSAAALIVAMALAYRPRWLSWLGDPLSKL